MKLKRGEYQQLIINKKWEGDEDKQVYPNQMAK